MRVPATTQLFTPSHVAAAAIGGADSVLNTVNTVEAFNGTSWSTAAVMPTARSDLGVGVLGTTLYGQCLPECVHAPNVY